MAGIKETLKRVPTLPTENTSTKDATVAVRRDYAGAQAKTNPAEIRLARKLDYRIMVCAVPHTPLISLNGERALASRAQRHLILLSLYCG